MRLMVRCAVLCGLQVLVFQELLAFAQNSPSGNSSGGYQYRTPSPGNRGSATGSRTNPTPPRPGSDQMQGRYQQPPRPGASSTRTPASAVSSGSTRTSGTPKPVAEPAAEKGPSPSVIDALKLVPTQKEVEFARPTQEEAAKCKISAQRISGAVGWVVEDSRGVTLRRFLDTNGDGKVDQWSYYKDGLEVYRDIDSDFNGKVDQCRWCSTAGTRWGIDRDEDGAIDSWRQISPEEVSRELVLALAKQEVDRFSRLVLTQDEVRSLGLGETKAGDLAQKTSGAAAKFKAMIGQQKLVTPETKWLQFSGSQPGVIPAGTDGSTKDIEVYENVLAIVQSGNDHGQLQIGTLVKLGQGWRVIDVPQASQEGQADSAPTGFFFKSPSPNRPQVAAGAPNEKSQALLNELEKLDAAINRAAAEEQAALNAKRADLLEQLAGEASKPEDRAGWIRQLADMVSAAVQSGGYPGGAKRLENLFDALQKSDQDKTLAAYVRFRQLTAEYGLAMQAKGADFSKVQGEWLKKLEQYVADYAKSPDAAEAMLQLAIAQEYAGQEEEAKKWYAGIVGSFSEAPAAKKAAGARRRLESVGRVIELQGKGPGGEIVELAKYRGKAVLIQYWATWCEPCKADMVILKDLLEKHSSTFAVIGVNLDTNAQTMSTFLAETKLPWLQICEEGGLDSRPALEMGILTLPTMILVDQEGKVVNRNISASELAGELKKLAR